MMINDQATKMEKNKKGTPNTNTLVLNTLSIGKLTNTIPNMNKVHRNSFFFDCIILPN